MSGQGERAFGAKGRPGFRDEKPKGIFSFEKRMSPPPAPPKEKRGGISISPRTPLKRHKGRGPRPPPLETTPQGGGERQRKEKQRTSYLQHLCAKNFLVRGTH